MVLNLVLVLGYLISKCLKFTAHTLQVAQCAAAHAPSLRARPSLVLLLSGSEGSTNFANRLQ